MQQKPLEIPDIEKDEKEKTTDFYKVVLYNDDWHTFDDVIFQLIKAINCSIERASELTFEVHYKGKAIVFEGSLNDCLKVTSILEEIDLQTQIII